MKALIACEYSGTVRNAFAARGWDAWSCDLLPTESPGNHLQMDCFDAIRLHGPWDFIGMHPPCTALCVSGNRHYGHGMPRNRLRKEAVKWTVDLWELACASAQWVYLENPIGVLSQLLGRPQIVQPWQFGHGETKATCLWLQNLAELRPTNIVEGREARIHRMPPSKDRGKLRSLAYTGIAEAMADQWTHPTEGGG